MCEVYGPPRRPGRLWEQFSVSISLWHAQPLSARVRGLMAIALCVFEEKGACCPCRKDPAQVTESHPNTEHTQPLAAPSATPSTSSGLLWSLWKSTGEEISAGSWDFLRDRIKFLLCGHGPVLPFLGKTCGLSDLGLEGTGTVSGLG